VIFEMQGIEKVAAFIVGAVVLLLIAGYLIVNLWPSITVLSGNVTAMTGTDQGTVIFQALWPVSILVIAIVIIVGLIFWALRHLGRE